MTTILRTDIGCPSVIGFVRELQRRGIRTIGVDFNPLSAGLSICDAGYVVPLGTDANYVPKILEICKKEKVNGVLAGAEPEVLSLVKNRDKFTDDGIEILHPSYEVVKTCADKVAISNALEEIGIKTPVTYTGATVQFPCAIKPIASRGGRDFHVVKTREELDFWKLHSEGCLVQEYISPKAEYSIDVLCDEDGNALSIVPRERIEVTSGISTKGRTVLKPELIKLAEKIAHHLKLYGGSCLQAIESANGEIYFIDINPRFGGGSILSMMANPSILDNVVNLVEHKPTIPSVGFKANLAMLRYYSEIFWVLE